MGYENMNMYIWNDEYSEQLRTIILHELSNQPSIEGNILGTYIKQHSMDL